MSDYLPLQSQCEECAAKDEEITRLRAQLAEKKMFPIQSSYGYKKPHPTTIPWSVADKAYSVYSARYGRDQSLERLAERGGFGPEEMDEFHPTWMDECSQLTEAQREVERLTLYLGLEKEAHESKKEYAIDLEARCADLVEGQLTLLRAHDLTMERLFKAEAEVEQRLRMETVPLPSQHYTDKILVLEARCARLEQTVKEVQDCGQSHFRYFSCMCGAHMKRTLAEGHAFVSDGGALAGACLTCGKDRASHTAEGQPDYSHGIPRDEEYGR